jgi:hypothetical protein
VSEEVRFFLRTALYTAAIGVVYWFVSYEWAGTVLLAFLAASVLFFVIVVSASIRTTRAEVEGHGDSAPRRAGNLINRLVGFEEHPGEASSAPLEFVDDVFPSASIWPFVLAAGITLVGLGLLYGPWLWIPGAGLTLAAGLSWLTEMKDPRSY